jgi:tRNA(Ile)-lysidine synthase
VAADPLDTARDTIRRHGMLAGGETVLVAVSGGADSTALLWLLHRLAPDWGLRLHALHVDHGLRPDSGRDAEAVRTLGARLGIPVEVAAVRVAGRGSLEAAARDARYAALETVAERIEADRIALGHTADDQAETLLMRMLEGTGVRGLAGIPPVRGRIIRPLLAVRHGVLVAALESAGLTWIEDPSNRDRRFFRNRVRHDILPLLAAGCDTDVVGALNRLARQARDTVEALERVAAAELARSARVQGEGLILPVPALAVLPRPVAAELLRQAAARLGSRAPLRAWAHRGLDRVLSAPAPRRPFRLGRLRIEVSGGLVRIGRASPPGLAPRPLPFPGTVALPEAGIELQTRLLPAAGYQVPWDPRRVAFDADALAEPLSVRGRRRGDRFQPFGAAGERRLKTLLIDARVPRWERDGWPLVEAGGTIVWVSGLRRSAAAPVTPATRRIMELTLTPLAPPGPGT